MADAPQIPTEEKLEAGKKAQDVENARWQDDFPEENLAIPYKRSEDGEEDKVDNPDEGKDPDEDEQVVETHGEPAPVVTVEDPGEYTAADYSFDVTLKDGKTVKVNTPEEAEKLADDPDNFETPKQLMDFINKQNKMNRNLDRDYDKWEGQKKTHDNQVATQQEREQTVQNLASGFEYLIAKGLMPKLDPKDAIADWSDPEIAKHEGVKEQVELINYMTKENEARQKAGIPVLGSALDAFNAFQLETGRKQKEDEQKEAGEQRKAASARVAGVSSSSQTPYVPKGIAVGNPNVLRRGSAAVWED